MKQGVFMHTFLQFLNTQPLLKPVRQEAGAVTGSIIDINNLQFGWRSNAAPVLGIDNLTIEPGERVFIEGPSGSGKSTLLNLLAGVVTPQQGKLKVLGRHLGELSGAARDRFRADHMGIIFQMFNLIPYLSVVENVTLPCRFSPLRRGKAVTNNGSVSVEAMRLLTHLEMDKPELLDRPVSELSVGQQQRVAAARALIGSPDLLIADEPTSSLDANLRESFIQLLFEECAKRGTTLIFVSHDSILESLFSRTIRLAEINRPEQSPIHGLEGDK
jgi:putative ABC transport system ATP-binding protein